MCKDTGLGSFPLQGDAANRIWRLVMTLVCEILACSQKLSLTGIPAHKWEPMMIRLRLMKYSTVIRPPHPPRHPALQGRTLLGRPPPRRVELLSDVDTQPCPLSIATLKKNPKTRKSPITARPTCGRPSSHPHATITPAAPATTPITPTQPPHEKSRSVWSSPSTS